MTEADVIKSLEEMLKFIDGKFMTDEPWDEFDLQDLKPLLVYAELVAEWRALKRGNPPPELKEAD